MENVFKTVSVIIFFVGASLIVPKIADATGSSNNSNNPRNLSSLTDGQYQPPNYGAPDSPNGSGTR